MQKLIAVLLICTWALTIQAQQKAITLKPGDPAPPIVAAKWFKGTPVKKFEKGQVYVLEFWATWCGPCKMAMPHLSELARKYRGKVTVIGFDVHELSSAHKKDGDYLTKVGNFVKNIGDGMDYTVAADVREDVMWNTWMAAAGLAGIPSSFVVDQDGRIAWIGSPYAELDEVLREVTAGRFNEETRKKVAAEWAEKRDRLDKLRAQLPELIKAGDDAQALKAAEELVENSIMGRGVFISMAYNIISKKDPDKAQQYAQQIMEKYAGDPISLQMFAQSVSKSKNKTEQALAIQIMEQALSRFAPDDPFAYSSMAEIYFTCGNIKKAVETQEKVLAIVSDNSLTDQKQPVKDKAKESLDKYKAAL